MFSCLCPISHSSTVKKHCARFLVQNPVNSKLAFFDLTGHLKHFNNDNVEPMHSEHAKHV